METELTTTPPRALISAMQVTLDGYALGDRDGRPVGDADTFESWADGLELLPPVDAFVLGGGMFPDYEQFWKTILDESSDAVDMLGRDPYPRELTYAREEIGALRQQAGKPVYVVGGPGLVTSLIDAGLLDEVRLIVHPVVTGRGMALFGGIAERQSLQFVSAEPIGSGRVNLTYRLVADGTTAED
jgi:dihydrofolate reductase